ncbi:MAG: zinc ribbon domain-containing protein [Tissierellaceae bacterium]|nr:zinc ribbon domain-containing protein [Tissierellaceae bacterium]
MFFVFGISTKEEKIDFNQTTICPSCGSYGRYEVFMSYTHFSLFFIPIFKWNKKYYVRTSCCNSLYSIDNELGKDIERGEKTTIHESDLHPININYNKESYCPSCNYKLDPDYEFCPRCGSKI